MTMGKSISHEASGGLFVGWAEGDITPQQPVQLSGQFHARVSEGVRDRLTVTALAMGSEIEHVVMVSCDLISISKELSIEVRQRIERWTEGPKAEMVILNATHTHTAPETRMPTQIAEHMSSRGSGVDLPVMEVADYNCFAADVITDVILEAWNKRKLGGISYGLGYAVVGRNRRWVNDAGASTMYNFEYIEQQGISPYRGL